MPTVPAIARREAAPHRQLSRSQSLSYPARPPFNAFEVIDSVLVPLRKAYHIYKVVGDNYAGELAKESVRRAGIGYELAAKHKSELYADPFLPMLNARKIDLPHNERAINQICSLERSVQCSGRDQITHPIHGHDDIARSHSGYALAPFDPNYQDPDLPPPSGKEDQYPSSANERLGDFYRSLALGLSLGPRQPW